MNACMEMMGGMMGGMGGMGGMMGEMLIPWLLNGLLLIGLITLGSILLLRGTRSDGWRSGKSQALQLLNTRLASGDIDVQEYEQRRRLISQQ